VAGVPARVLHQEILMILLGLPPGAGLGYLGRIPGTPYLILEGGQAAAFITWQLATAKSYGIIFSLAIY
jgi:hypothetical protein